MITIWFMNIYIFFNTLKNEINIKRYMFVLKEFLSKEVYENLENVL